MVFVQGDLLSMRSIILSFLYTIKNVSILYKYIKLLFYSLCIRFIFVGKNWVYFLVDPRPKSITTLK